MFSSKDSTKKETQLNPDVVETIIGTNTVLTGDIVSEGSVRIDGKVTGTVTAKGNLILGEKGSLLGNGKGKNIVIGGHIAGNIEAAGKVEINASGTLEGDMVAAVIVIEDGARFTGNCKMESPKPAVAALPEPAKGQQKK